MTANTTQVGGTHYAAEYQHWDLVWDCQMGYFPGQITKYVMRHTKKNGVEDLRKSLHVTQKYMEVLNTLGNLQSPVRATPHIITDRLEAVALYCKANSVHSIIERLILTELSLPHEYNAVVHVETLINQLIKEYPSCI